MRVLIVGCGRVGSRLASELDGADNEVTIVDREPGSFNKFAQRGLFGENSGVRFVVGDGTDAELLRRAGIEEADCLIAVTEGDNRNIMAAQIAKHVFGVRRVVARIYDPIREEAYQEMGLDSFCPTIEGANRVRQMIAGH